MRRSSSRRLAIWCRRHCAPSARADGWYAPIHMSDIPAFPYAALWEERSIVSVANLTRSDGEEFLKLAAAVPIRTHVTAMPLAKANAALTRLRKGEVQGALVLIP